MSERTVMAMFRRLLAAVGAVRDQADVRPVAHGEKEIDAPLLAELTEALEAVERMGAVVLDAATAATAAEACAYAADVDDEQAAARDKLRGEQGEEYRASARRYRAAAAELREGGQR